MDRVSGKGKGRETYLLRSNGGCVCWLYACVYGSEDGGGEMVHVHVCRLLLVRAVSGKGAGDLRGKMERYLLRSDEGDLWCVVCDVCFCL